MSTSLSKSANQFAVDLFQCYLRRHGDKYRNLLLCPYLIYHSLAMMLVGAKGNTANQLMKLLRIPPTPTTTGSPTTPLSSTSNQSYSSSLFTRSQATKGASKSGGNDQTRPLNKSPSPSPSICSGVSGSSIGSSNTHSSLSSLAEPTGATRSPVGRRQGSAARGSSSSPGPALATKPEADRSSRSVRRGDAIVPPLIGEASKSRRLTPDWDEARHREFLMLTEQLIHGNHEFVHLASFIYLDKGTKRTERYKNILRDYYETKPKKIDFDNVDLMVKTINEDVARTTENIYNDILSKAEAQKLEKSYMLLVNAVFFRGFWLSNFTDVKRAPFVKAPSQPLAPLDLKQQQQTTTTTTTSTTAAQQQQVPQTPPMQYSVNMMSKLDYVPVVSDQQLDARIVKLPFEASDLQMLLILPNNRQSDSTYLCEKISAAKINHIVEEFAKSKNKTVKVSMPIFCIDSGKISIQSTLVHMGASDLFDKTKASMSGVCENKQVWLHKILHRCFIVCDNRGAITSSAFEKARKRQAKLSSGISFGRSGVDEFVADHPFMYIIMDSVTKTILLIGLYTDPRETLEVIHENQLSPEEAHQIYTEGVYKT